MERKIVILGAAHSLTVGAREPDYTPAELSHFRETIKGLCETHKVKGIAEGMGKDGLEYYRKTHTIGHDVAKDLGVEHEYLDPSRADGIALGIGDAEDVAAEQSLNSLQEGKISLDHEAKRARIWFDKLVQIDRWPTLMICGPNHVEHFRMLAEGGGVDVAIAAHDFRPRDS